MLTEELTCGQLQELLGRFEGCAFANSNEACMLAGRIAGAKRKKDEKRVNRKQHQTELLAILKAIKYQAQLYGVDLGIEF